MRHRASQCGAARGAACARAFAHSQGAVEQIQDGCWRPPAPHAPRASCPRRYHRGAAACAATSACTPACGAAWSGETCGGGDAATAWRLDCRRVLEQLIPLPSTCAQLQGGQSSDEGALSRHDMRLLYAAAHAFVLPTRCVCVAPRRCKDEIPPCASHRCHHGRGRGTWARMAADCRGHCCCDC